MGYDNRLYIAKKRCSTTEIEGKTYHYAEIVATFELCGVDDDVRFAMRGCPATDVVLYLPMSDVPIIRDAYDEPLKEIPLKECAAILMNAEAKEHYRRYQPCIALLNAFNEHEWDDELVVLHYGH